MSFDLKPITDDSGLHTWIGNGAWIPLFDVATLNRAKPYSSPKLIDDLSIERRKAVGGATRMRCTVNGTSVQPYRISLSFTPVGAAMDLEAHCSCPVGWRCKHAAAVLIMLARVFAEGRGGLGGGVSAEVERWLALVRKSAVDPRDAPGSKPENRFLAYCIENNDAADGMHFVLRVGTRRKDGGFSISETRSYADLTYPPKYVVREDYPLVAAFQALVRKNARWGDPRLQGEGWWSLLEGAAALGRLFYGEPIDADHIRYQYRGEMSYSLLVAGPEEWISPDWRELDDGSMQPFLRASRRGIVALPVRPIMYLDHERHTVGRVLSDLSEELLVAWDKGPVVEKRDLPEVAKLFGELTEATLPPPMKLDTVEHASSAPTACLNIGKAADGGFHGCLLIRYGDSAPMVPLSVRRDVSYTQLIGGSRHLWTRDGKAEHAFQASLAGMGFVPGIGTGARKPNEYRITAKVLGDGAAEMEDNALAEQLLWVRFLESEAIGKLRAEGWEIEVAEKAGLAVYDVEDFFPEIEGDPDHGIDWFSFDVPHEINGRRVSLIPIIAQAIREGLPSADDPDLPEHMLVPCDDPADGMLRFPTRRLIEIVDQVRHLFHGKENFDGPMRLDRLAAAGVADGLSIDGSATLRALAQLGKNLRTLTSLPGVKVPRKLKAELREYQIEGFRWLQFLAEHGLHGILADDMGLGKTVQTLAHLAAEREKKPGNPSLVIAPTSVAPNWAAEAARFTPHLKTILWQGKDRAARIKQLAKADLVITSYPLLAQDFDVLSARNWHVLALDEAQYIKNPKALTARNACKLNAAHRICLSGTPMENHLGELWSLMRFLMPGFLADEKTFNTNLRKPIERDRSADAQLALNRRVAPLILRRTKDAVAKDLPEKTEIIHGIDLNGKQTDLYESVRAAMDKRVRDAISEKGLAKSHIIVLDALLKLRQICCHPKLLKTPAAQKVEESAKLDFLTEELLPTLIEEGRRILLFSTFTSMLAIIEEHLGKQGIRFLKITGQTTKRAALVKEFQEGDVPVFLISLKAGGTGLNLTAADTVIHFDPWWNPAAENQATDRAHRIGQSKPVFVHKLVCRGSIEERMLELQKHKSGLVEALLSEETSKLRIDPETLGHLLAPIQ
jgi:superfamily II DNA or RNA helicase